MFNTYNNISVPSCVVQPKPESEPMKLNPVCVWREIIVGGAKLSMVIPP